MWVIRDMWEDGLLGRFLLLLMALVVLSVPAIIYGARQEAEEWETFAKAHDCRVVGRISGSTGVGFGVAGNGQAGTVVTTTPGKTGYLCDDGVTYWR